MRLLSWSYIMALTARPNAAKEIYIIYQYALGLQEASGDRYLTAGIDRTLNVGLTLRANSINIFFSIFLLNICFQGRWFSPELCSADN